MTKIDEILERAIHNSVSAEWEVDVKWLVAELKRLSAPVTDEESSRSVKVYSAPGGCLRLVLQDFLKGRMS